MMPKRALALAVLVATTVTLPDVLLAQKSGAAEVSLSRGIKSFMGEDYKAARRHFEAALSLEPDFPAGHYFLGLTLLQTATDSASRAERCALLERAVAEFEQARLRDPQMILAYLDAAVAQTILGRFDDAHAGFQAFLSERPDDPLPYLFLAVAHYRQSREDSSHLPKAIENLDKAEEALERGGVPNRSLEAHIKFYRGLVYIQQKKRGAAREVLQEGYDLAPESDLGLKSKQILDELVERRPWDLTLRLGLDYDTNVTLKGDHVRSRLGEESGSDWRFGLGSNFTYRMVDSDEWLLGVGLNTFNTWHTDIDEFNIQTYGANVFLAHSPDDADWLTLSIRYDWDHTLVGNESFLSRHRITPQIDIRETDWTSTTVFYQFDARNYLNQPGSRLLDRDGTIHSVGVIQRFELGQMYERPLTMDLGYRFEDVDARGREFTYDSHIFTLGVGVPLPWDMTFDFVTEFAIENYRFKSSFDLDRSQRRDFINTMLFSLTKKFSEQLSAGFQVVMTTDDSNVRDRFGQEFFSYDRVVYGLTLQYRF